MLTQRLASFLSSSHLGRVVDVDGGEHAVFNKKLRLPFRNYAFSWWRTVGKSRSCLFFSFSEQASGVWYAVSIELARQNIWNDDARKMNKQK